MDTTTLEIWKDIRGYEGHYQVSNRGQVRSLTKMVRYAHGLRPYAGRIVAFSDNPSGYFYVHLYRDNKSKSFRVNRLVAEAFTPNPEGKKTVNHEDGDLHNNLVGNLAWMTQKEQIHHSRDKLGNLRGESAGASKLAMKEILAIRSAVPGTKSQATLALEFGVTQSTISDILRRKTWSHI